MNGLRALSFRRFTLPSIADLVWAKRARAQIGPMSRRDTIKLRRRRPSASSALLLRLELINTLSRATRKHG